MKIGFDAKRAFCNYRGLGNYSRNAFFALTEHFPDNEYYLFTPETKPTFAALSFPHSQKIMPSSRLFSNYWRSYGCKKEIQKLHLDIYHGLSHELPVGIERTNVKSVVTIHDLIFLTHPQLYTRIDRKLYEKKYYRSALASDKIIAISQQTKLDLMELWRIPEDKIEVVYQGCSPQFLQSCSPEELERVRQTYHLPSQYLLHVGTIERRKNQEVIIRAMRDFKLDIPLVLAGRHTDYVKDLWAIDADFVRKNVIFLENFAEDALPAIYQNASLFIYPSLYEGFGIPILEALSSRLPVITAEGRCLREAGGDGAIYVSATNSELLATKITEILHDSELYQYLVQQGCQQIQKFTPSAIATNLMNVYNSLL